MVRAHENVVVVRSLETASNLLAGSQVHLEDVSEGQIVQVGSLQHTIAEADNLAILIRSVTLLILLAFGAGT